MLPYSVPSVVLVTTQDIKHVNECKFLGIYLDTHLTWKRHIERISSRISSAIFAINRARDFLSKHALRCLNFALVHSHLTYGIHVWGNSRTINQVITLQKRAIRTINKVWYHSHTEPSFKSNQILKLEDMYTMQISLFVYDLNNDLLPKSFRNFVSQNCLARHDIISRQNNFFPQIIMVNMILCIYNYILCNNVLFYYRVSQEDGSMPCDKPVNVL